MDVVVLVLREVFTHAMKVNHIQEEVYFTA